MAPVLGLSNRSQVMALKIVVLPVPLSPKMEALRPSRTISMAAIPWKLVNLMSKIFIVCTPHTETA